MAKKARLRNNRLADMTIKINNDRRKIKKAEGEKRQKLEQELAQLILDRETLKGLSNSIRNAEGENKQNLDQKPAQMILDRKTFEGVPNSTKKKLIGTIAVYPVVPNSTALPGWVQSVHTSHQVVLVGGLMGCLRCGSIVAARPFTLRKRCAGRYKPSASLAQRWERLGRGILPGSHKTWPDELAAPRDVRTVDSLRHTGSEWVLGSQVAVVVFTRMSGGASLAWPHPGVSWDPYFPFARVE